MLGFVLNKHIFFTVTNAFVSTFTETEEVAEEAADEGAYINTPYGIYRHELANGAICAVYLVGVKALCGDVITIILRSFSFSLQQQQSLRQKNRLRMSPQVNFLLVTLTYTVCDTESTFFLV